MRPFTKSFVLAAAIAAGSACGSGDGGSGPGPGAITGTWQLTKMLFVTVASPTQSIDLIAVGGTATLTFDPDKTFTIQLNMPSVPPETLTGTWSLSSDVLTLIPDWFTGNMQFDITLSGQTLKLAGAHVGYDVDGDGADEPSILTIEGTK
jgi:hypothetical protein